MELGAFSVSLSVKDLNVSRAFYEKLGFERTGGDGQARGDDKTYVMMVNGTTVVGLFQGLFKGNILTFNPGLGQDMAPLGDFTDVRQIRESLVAAGIEMSTDTDPDATGPAHIAFQDPDGNAVLIDQFFPRPKTRTDRDDPSRAAVPTDTRPPQPAPGTE